MDNLEMAYMRMDIVAVRDPNAERAFERLLKFIEEKDAEIKRVAVKGSRCDTD